MTNDIYLQRLKHINTKNYYLVELMAMIDFNRDVNYLRVFLYKNKIEYKRTTRHNKKRIFIDRLKSVDTAKLTLSEIKEKAEYYGSITALMEILIAEKMPYKRKTKYDKRQYKLEINISNIGNTTQYTPQELIDKLNIETINPASFLRTLNIPYKTR
jgi:hypothetical protein